MKMELRVQDSELRSNEDGTMSVSGYVNLTEQLSETLGVTKRFKEKIARGTFSRAIRNATKDIDFLSEHKQDKILASTRNNSLQLKEDEQGLFMEATITPTSWGKDAYELIKSGIHRNMSFGFRTISDSWKPTASGIFERTITEMELMEISVVKNPAYSQSTISSRGIDLIEEVEIPEIEEKQEVREVKRNLPIEIAKQSRHIEALRSMKKNGANISDSRIHMAENTLEELMEESRMINDLKKEIEELRTLQGTDNQSAIGQAVSPISELMEATSSVVAKARKVEMKAGKMKLPYQTALEDAKFVVEGEDIPEIALNLTSHDLESAKRVGISQSFSKQVINEADGLDQHSKDMLVKRVAKKIEEEVLAGDGVKGLKGISGDVLVPSKNVAMAPTGASLRALYLAVHSDYRSNAQWYVSAGFFEKIALLTEADGSYLMKSERIDGKVISTIWGHQVEVSNGLQVGDTIGQVPVIFADVANCYTLAISKDVEVKNLVDTKNVLRGSVAFTAEMYCNGGVHNYQAVAKGTIVA
ncbi:phage major capsid protein [Peribacillus frigoritolerans]|uniref:phage major capsid protein n=1 Tax=Peribacillus frigoritolerans TaxID=450367 RepID=UPI002E211C65|nr:phage major capsid protein [Peribacillus frigoritolerans]MED3788527.1 phage major capsid protein [Peribacillus frigoritolerans]